MENTINALIFVAGIVAAVYFANYTRTEASSKREQKSNDIFTFCMPCITALALGILLIDFYYLPIVITVALFAGTLALLVSWTSEKKAGQKAKKEVVEKAVKNIILIIDDCKTDLFFLPFQIQNHHRSQNQKNTDGRHKC